MFLKSFKRQPYTYLSISLSAFILSYIFYSMINIQGVPLGGDWNFPVSLSQAKIFSDYSGYTWSGMGRLWGLEQVTVLTSAFFLETIHIAWEIVGDVNIILALLITFCCILSLSGVLLLVLYLGGSVVSGTVAGWFFIFSPIIFNFFLFGWINAIFAISLLPLGLWTFLKGSDNNNMIILFLSGLIFSLSAAQSQAIIWFLICFILSSLIYIIVFKRSIQIIKALIVVCTIFLFCNMHWIPILFLYPPVNVVSGDLVSSVVSIGSDANLSLINSMLGWGSTYNFQYERILLDSNLSLASLFLPFMAVVGLMSYHSNKRFIFALLLLFPFILLLISNNRFLLEMIPFSSAFRDLSRFLILPFFGMVVLGGLGVDVYYRSFLLRNNILHKITFFIILSIALIGVSFPWWSGEMTDFEASAGPDFRLRSMDFPESYFSLEEKINREMLGQKALYYPVGGTVSFKYDKRFYGAYNETADIFAGLSPIPGLVSISDRNFGVTDDISNNLIFNEPSVEQLDMLANSGVRLYIFRNNLINGYPVPSKALINKMLDTGKWRLWYKNKEIVVYEATKARSNVYVETGQNNSSVKPPSIEFRKINPTMFRVLIKDVKNKFNLVLNESFSNNWRIIVPSDSDLKDFSYPRNDFSLDNNRHEKLSMQNSELSQPNILDIISMPELKDGYHRSLNSFVNTWTIDPEKICSSPNYCSKSEDGTKNINLIIHFKPQILYYIGSRVSLFSYIILILVLIVMTFVEANKRMNLSKQ
jgi:hypothetical protein